jgi:hypothetical protein
MAIDWEDLKLDKTSESTQHKSEAGINVPELLKKLTELSRPSNAGTLKHLPDLVLNLEESRPDNGLRQVEQTPPKSEKLVLVDHRQPSLDKPQEANNLIGERFFNAGAGKNEWNGDKNGLRETLSLMRKELSPEEFVSLVEKLEKGTAGLIKATKGPDGNIHDVTIGRERPQVISRDSWQADQALRWNDSIGTDFFQSGETGTKFNGDTTGLASSLREASQSLSPAEFAKLKGMLGGGIDDVQIKEGKFAGFKLSDSQFDTTGKKVSDWNVELLPPPSTDNLRGTVDNTASDKPVVVVASVKQGDFKVMKAFVVQPGQKTPDNLDIDGIVTDEEVKPIYNPLDKKWYPPETIGVNIKVTKIAGGVTAVMGADGRIVDTEATRGRWATEVGTGVGPYVGSGLLTGLAIDAGIPIKYNKSGRLQDLRVGDMTRHPVTGEESEIDRLKK